MFERIYNKKGYRLALKLDKKRVNFKISLEKFIREFVASLRGSN